MRFSAKISSIVLLSVLAFSASAQETTKDLAAKASAELRLLTAFQTLERMTSQMNHFLTYSIQAERGGWGVLEFVETTDYTNQYVLAKTAEDVLIEVARANNAISKSKVAMEDELGNAQTAFDNLNQLMALAPQISDMIAAGDLDAAAELYHQSGRPAYEDALRNAQSGAGSSQKRLAKTLLDIRLSK